MVQWQPSSVKGQKQIKKESVQRRSEQVWPIADRERCSSVKWEITFVGNWGIWWWV